MKKPLFFLLALGSAGFSLATAAPSAAPGAATHSRTQSDIDEDQGVPSPEALCREVQVQIDEGYGVSANETRLVCDETP